jgi:hypothetical protein
MVRPERLFELRAHPFGAALRAFSAEAALCFGAFGPSSSASLRTAVALRASTSNLAADGEVVELPRASGPWSSI